MDAASRFVTREFPRCEGAILAGSVVRGAATTESDLDLVIFDESAGMPFRRTYRAFGWLIEAFVLTRGTYRYFFDQGVDSAIPSLQRMCADGVALRGSEAIGDIVAEARAELLAGPPAWERHELDGRRYALTETLADLAGSKQRAERLHIVQRLTGQLTEFALRTAGQWLGDGKWAYRGLVAWNETYAAQLTEALERFYEADETALLERLVRATLAPFGGPLQEGYAEGDDWPEL